MLARWRERDVFRESLRNREGGPRFVFYEGPPTANGYPGAHHVLARVFKDVFPRYKTMTGHYVERKGGWDTHGLPVEIAVEQKLGFTSKEDIERYGIAEFNRQCREAVLEHLEDWQALTERIAYWVDLDEAYYTLEPSYIESVWWALKTMWDRDLLYEGHKVVPYCARCGTALSSHEVAQGYRDVEDPSVYVRLPITKPAGALREGDTLLVWTTTPWTLVTNAAVAVDPELTYVRTAGGEILAEALVERVIGEGAEITDRFPGSELLGAGYEPPFGFIPAEAWGPKAHTVLPGDFVTADDGTGIVHTAIAFGEDDYRLGAEQGLEVVNPVRLDGTYDERIGPYAGRWVKDADPDLIEDLRARGRLFRAETLVHAYPHCWRCGTPLLYYAKPSWYIRTSALRDRLLAANETVTWHPEHIKHGRFGKWLEDNVDWAISRERYWGTPLPIWRCENGHVEAVGSFAEVGAALGPRAARPAPAVRRRAHVAVRRVRRRDAPRARGHRRLVRLRLDAVRAAPRAVRERGAVPRDVPRRLHLRGDRPDARLVLLADRDLDAAVRPGAVPDRARPRPHRRSAGQEDVEVARQHRGALGGHPAPRRRRVPLVLPDVQAAVGRLPVLDRDVGESVRQFLLQLWNTYGFYVLYANANDDDGARRAGDRARPLGDLAAQRDRRRGPRSHGGVRRHARGPGDRGVRRRALELVRPPLTAAVLGRRPRGVRDAQDRAGHGHEAARAVHAVRRRRDLREPRRQPAERPPRRLPGGRSARPRRSRPRWRSRARPSGSASPRAGTASSRCASRCARPSWSPPTRSARRSSACRTSCSTSSTSRSCASSRRRASSAPTRSSRTTARSARGSASRCRRSPRRWPRSTPATSPPRCATVGRSGSTSAVTTTCSGRTTWRWRCSRSRATSWSARARTRSRWSSSSITSCAARGSRARSCTRSRTRARPRACRSRTGSRCRSAATRSCSPPRATTRRTSRRRRSR